jgi:FkbM family methyltransferase
VKRWKLLHAAGSLLFAAAAAAGSWMEGPLLALLYGSIGYLVWRYGRKGLQAADRVTIARAAGTLPLVLLPWSAAEYWLPAAAVLGVLESTDLIDGRLARRNGPTRFGAVLDEETDAFFMLVVTYLLVRRAELGIWVLAAGALRYLFVLIYVLPGRRREQAAMPETFSRFARAVCAASSILLIGGFVEPLPAGMRTALPAAALALLLISFGWEAVLRGAGAVVLPPRGFFRSWIIYYGLPWKRGRMKRMYRRFIEPGSLAFDLGSHLGNRIDVWNRLGASIVALEPNPASFRYLERRYGQLPGVTLLSLAAGSESGEGLLHIDPRNPTLATLSRRWIGEMSRTGAFRRIQWSSTCPVQVTTLDELIECYGRPDFCKIDVEGFEYEVLTGLSRPLPALSFEYLPQGTEQAERCLDRLEMLGDYEYRISRRETMRFTSRSWLSAEEVRRFLHELRDGDSAGDIYGRLRT